MNYLEKYNLNLAKIAKIFGLVLLGIVIVLLFFSLVNSLIRSFTANNQYYQSTDEYSVSPMRSVQMKNAEQATLSSRNLISYDEDFTPGSDLENFEVTEYVASIDTRKLDDSCERISALKERDYVIFENSDKGDNSCYYKFKVKKDNVPEILEVIDSLNPRELNENIQTIKSQIEDFTSEEDVLKRKLQTIDDTLSSAIISYDEISKLATQTRDASSLASIIDSKIKIIERLSQEKIDTSALLERISRLKSEQLDRLEYTYFNVYIYENKYVDLDQLRDSWKRSIKSFVVDINGILQDLSVGLLLLIAYTFQYLLYFLIIVITAKYVWKFFKRVWQK